MTELSRQQGGMLAALDQVQKTQALNQMLIEMLAKASSTPHQKHDKLVELVWSSAWSTPQPADDFANGTEVTEISHDSWDPIFVDIGEHIDSFCNESIYHGQRRKGGDAV